MQWLPSLLAVSLCGVTLPSASAEPPDYLRDIKPLLTHRCASCHGTLRQEGKLRLDVSPMWRRGDEAGVVITPGDPTKSRLFLAVTGAEGVSKMPEEGPPLTPAEIELLRAWIAAGAQAPDEPVPPDPRQHWSFVPPVRPAVPMNGAGNVIDAFLTRAWAERGLTPQPLASPDVLLRRVCWDLVGRPPTMDELTSFRHDSSPEAYERLVDRLLLDPRHGERWARHWMDVWRYSDWYGYAAELRNSQRHIWRWRDWIVESLNSDKPYAQMIQEMLAADELDPLNPESLRATGFLARNYYVFNRDVWLDNTVEHTSKAFLGLTMNCARCHHHMYDPFPQQAYYELRAVFEPYKVRVDRLPGNANTDQHGVARVFDADLQAATYVYERGNDKKPRKDQPIAPGVPEFLLGRGLQVDSVAMPLPTQYPGMQAFIRDETRRAAESTLTQRRAEMPAAETKATQTADALAPFVDFPADALQPGGPHPQAVAVEYAAREAALALTMHQRQLTEAEADWAAITARLSADDAQYDPQASETLKQERATAAVTAERELAVHKAAAALAQAEWNIARHAHEVQQGDAKKTQPLQQAQQAAEAARKQLAEAEQKRAMPASGEYTSFTPKYPAQSTGRRTALARWITDRQNPLAARMAVNQLWLRHFGQPLVESVFDFGHNGRRPEFPELLDWLAVELMDSGWSLRHIHRLIVTSDAYRRSSTTAGAASDTLARDPDNHSLWRFPTRRLESEAVRDGVLFAAGAMDDRVGGPELDPKDGLTGNRRSLYFRHAPEKTMEFLQLFDAASCNESYRRETTIVPQQALALVNSGLTHRLSSELAAELSTIVGTQPDHDADFVVAAFQRILTRDPTGEELRMSTEFLRQPARTRANLVHVLFNHNDFVTVR